MKSVESKWFFCALAIAMAIATGEAEGAGAQEVGSVSEEMQVLNVPPDRNVPSSNTPDETSRARRIFRIQDASWRFEVAGGGALPGGSRKAERDGDIMFTGTVDYEIPFMAYGAFGPRLMPIFVYDQRRADVLVGGGGGLAIRVYHVKDEQRGFFLEGEALVLGHYHRFRKDGSHIDFITGGGVGYKCRAGWHAIVKFEHISNAGISSDNSGVNVLSAGIGWSFRSDGRRNESGERLAKAQGGQRQ